jgi:hypothetical protein
MMAAVLDQVVRIGDIAVAAVVERAVIAIPLGTASICGSKAPVAVLVHERGTTIAFDIAGARVPLDTFDRRFPRQRARFERQVAGVPLPARP